MKNETHDASFTHHLISFATGRARSVPFVTLGYASGRYEMRGDGGHDKQRMTGNHLRDASLIPGQPVTDHLAWLSSS